jgi:hypothetical protein
MWGAEEFYGTLVRYSTSSRGDKNGVFVKSYCLETTLRVQILRWEDLSRTNGRLDHYNESLAIC